MKSHMLFSLRRMLLGLILTLPLAANAADIDVVKAFYSDLLSNPRGEDLGDRVRKVVVEDWVSIPTPRGGKGAEGFVNSLRGFGQKLPSCRISCGSHFRSGNF